MDKKNNSGKVDNAKVFGMFENLRKNLSSPRDGANADKNAEKAASVKLPSSTAIKGATERVQADAIAPEVVATPTVETPAKTEPAEKVEKTAKKSSFDGIIYNGGSTEPKPKKKYNSYRNDQPLFFFDSFEEDDEEFTGEDKTEEVAEVVQTVEAPAVEKIEEVAEVEEAEEIAEVEEIEEVTEVEETEEITEVEEIEEIAEVEETEEVTEVEEAEEVTEVEEAEEVAEVEEIEEVTEAEEAEEVTEVEETEEVAEVEETEEVAEVEEIEEIAEVEEAEEVTEVEETEEVTEVEEAEEVAEVEEAEEVTEVEEIEEVTEIEEIEEVAEAEEIDDTIAITDSDGAAVYGEYKTVEIIEDGEFKVVKAIDSYGDYKIVIVKVDDDGHYDIYDVFDTDGGDERDERGASVESEIEVATEVEVDEEQITVAEEIAVEEISIPEVDLREQVDHTVDDSFDNRGAVAVDNAEAATEVDVYSDEPTVAEELLILGAVPVDDDDYDEDSEPVVATEIEEAVSIAEEYSVGIKQQDRYKNLFSGDLFEEVDEPLTVATEIEDISLATEITSNIVLPGEADETTDDDPELDPESPDWVQDESFLRECAQLELPKLQSPMKDINSTDEDQISEFVNSGYEYAELPMLDAYIVEKARRKREEGKGGKNSRTTDEATRPDEELRAEFYEKRANGFRAKCASRSRAAMKSVIYTAILAIIVLFFENIGKIASVPIVGAERAILMLIFDMALIFVGAIVIQSSLKESVSALLKLRYNCESVGVLALILTVIYGVIAAVTYSGEGEIPFIGVPMICCLLYSAALRYVAIKRDEALFNAACDEGEYCTLAELERNSAVPEFKELRGMIGENAGIYRPNYPRRSEKGYSLEGGSVDVGVFGVAVTAIALVLSVIAGIVRFSVGGSSVEALATAVIALAFSLPVFLSVSIFAENSSLMKRSAQNGALILDRSTATSIKNGAVLLINDTDLFRSGDVKIVGFDINGADKDDRTVEMALGRIVNVIRSVGGTLSELFAQLGEGIDIAEAVEVVDVSEKGLSAYSGNSCIRIGSASYLGRFGVPVNVDNTERKDGEKMLYASENGVLCLRIVLSYTANKALCKRIDRLRGYGVAVSVKTCDPCIDTELLMRTTGIEPELLRVVKYAIDDPRENEDGERDGGIVSTRGVEGLITALGNCARHGISVKRLKAVSAVSSLAVPVALILMAAMAMPFTAIPLWTVGAYYGGSALLALILAKLL